MAPLWPSARDLRGQGAVSGRFGGWFLGDPTERQEHAAKCRPQNLNLRSLELEMKGITFKEGVGMHFFRLHTKVLNIPHTLQVKTFSLCSHWHLVGKTVDGSIGDVKDEPGSPRGLAQMISG